MHISLSVTKQTSHLHDYHKSIAFWNCNVKIESIIQNLWSRSNNKRLKDQCQWLWQQYLFTSEDSPELLLPMSTKQLLDNLNKHYTPSKVKFSVILVLSNLSDPLYEVSWNISTWDSIKKLKHIQGAIVMPLFSP